MNLRLESALAALGAACLCAVTAIAVQPEESNLWPLMVTQTPDEEGVERWSSLGPLRFGSTDEAGNELRGFRPLWHHFAGGDDSTAVSIAYPFWHHVTGGASDRKRWTFFNLINSDSGSDQVDRFSVWPFYFSRDSGEEESSYRALFPLYGDIQNRFGQARLKWLFAPLFVRYQNDREITTATPWPFIKTISGDGHAGFEFWPLAGKRQEVGVSQRRFFLWPLGFSSKKNLHTEEPTYRSGFLPFYAQSESTGFRSESFLWPFFGYVDRTSPVRYQAKHLLYPFWVQGRGEERYVNRWAPFYSHSRSPARTQTWIFWPLWRDQQWSNNHLHHQRQQLFYFVYHAEVQSSLQSPDLAAAIKRHVWPLFSHWNNGAGQVQVQAFSPFDVFFPHNERMRQMWSPLFALYRFNQSKPGETRHSFLWDAITYADSSTRQHREFHLGPLFDYTRNADGKRWGFLSGLLNIERASNGSFWASSRLSSPSRR